MSAKKVKICEIVQQLEHIDLEKFVETLQKHEQIKEYAFIVHDQDRNDEGLIKEPHIHCVLRLKNANGFQTIGNWFGIPANYVGKIKGRVADALNYLTHLNAPSKHQYSDEEVVSNFDWKEERKSGKRTSGNKREEEIINKIVNGDIRGFNMSEQITALEYVKYKRAIEGATKYRTEMLKAESAKGERHMEVIYIEGLSGSGKTTYAKDIANKKGYSICISSSSNDLLQDYQGQDCLILDDLRPNVMPPTDLLKLLDNNTSSTVKSRYYNKFLECKIVIVTSVTSITDFTKEWEKEPPEQLYRRCKTLIRMDDQWLEMLIYHDEKKKYERIAKGKNPVAMKYRKRGITEEDKKRAIAILPDFEVVEDTEAPREIKRAKDEQASAFDLDPRATAKYFPNWEQRGLLEG